MSIVENEVGETLREFLTKYFKDPMPIWIHSKPKKGEKFTVFFDGSVGELINDVSDEFLFIKDSQNFCFYFEDDGTLDITLLELGDF